MGQRRDGMAQFLAIELQLAGEIRNDRHDTCYLGRRYPWAGVIGAEVVHPPHTSRHGPTHFVAVLTWFEVKANACEHRTPSESPPMPSLSLTDSTETRRYTTCARAV